MKMEVSSKTAQNWNKKARDRSFQVGDLVLVRKPGLDTKLRESWEGPGKILAKNSPMSYKVETDKRVLNTVNIQQLKLFVQPKQIRRVTSVLEGDTEADEITHRYSEAKLQPQQLTDSQQDQLKTILDKHQKVLTKEPGLTDKIQFDIDTGQTEPIYQRAYNSPVSLKSSIDIEIDWLLSKNYIRPSTSPWSSPMVTVRKPDGSARLCVDFKCINKVTRQMPFHMPRFEEILEGVGQSKFVSKLDLSKGYYHIRMVDTDIEKTAFTCHRGKFEFLRMPIGVKNAPAVFQQLMQDILTDYREFTAAYMDDIVIYSGSWESYLAHIDTVLTALKQAGLTANPTKCRWSGTAIEFLGHQVGGEELIIPAHRVQALSQYTKPTTKKGLRAFLGSVGFYRRYMKDLGQQTAVLTPLTSKRAPQRVDWSVEGMEAFNTIISFISNASSLCIPLPRDKFSVVTDASGRGIGGVLQVYREEEWQPTVFFSRQLRGAEQRYSDTELEALALAATVEHFGYYLYGREFVAYTDHKPLEQLLTSARLNPRLRRISYKL